MPDLIGASLACPACGSRQGSEVTDSRVDGEGVRIRRRRQCLGCHARFTTYEMAFDPAVFFDQRQRAKLVAAELREMAHALEVW